MTRNLLDQVEERYASRASGGILRSEVPLGHAACDVRIGSILHSKGAA
jgi:hypothetical protein